MISLQQARELEFGQMLYHNSNRNSDGTPQRWKVNGKVRLWMRDPDRIEIPVKNALRNYGTVYRSELDMVSLTEEDAIANAK